MSTHTHVGSSSMNGPSSSSSSSPAQTMHSSASNPSFMANGHHGSHSSHSKRSNGRSKSSWGAFPKQIRLGFWRSSTNKLPGGARRTSTASTKKTVICKGAQHPPLYHPADLQALRKKRKSVAITLSSPERKALSRLPPINSNEPTKNKDPSSSSSFSPDHIPEASSLPSSEKLNQDRSDDLETKNPDKLPPPSSSSTQMKKKRPDESINVATCGWDELKTEEQRQLRREHNKRVTLAKLMSEDTLNSDKYSEVAWKGVPADTRAQTWRVLLGYVPKNSSRREMTIQRKRDTYKQLISLYFENKNEENRSNPENQIIHQIGLDVPRTSPSLRFFQIPVIKSLLTRALFIWSHRHTATGYVQGINDLITPFVYVFLDELLRDQFDGMTMEDENAFEIICKMTEDELINVEADSYWCLDQFLESFQTNYTHEQPGIQAMVEKFQKLVEECDSDHFMGPSSSSTPSSSLSLAAHFASLEPPIEFMHFSFRWMNCFLMREFTLKQIIRMWDTYLSEYHLNSDNVVEFHIFVCVALLLSFKKELVIKQFAEGMLFIQNLPTKEWTERDLSILMASAHAKRLQWSASTRIGSGGKDSTHDYTSRVAKHKPSYH